MLACVGGGVSGCVPTHTDRDGFTQAQQQIYREGMERGRGGRGNIWNRGEVRGGGLGSRPKKMYGERLGDGVEYHSMKPTPRR